MFGLWKDIGGSPPVLPLYLVGGRIHLQRPRPGGSWPVPPVVEQQHVPVLQLSRMVLVVNLTRSPFPSEMPVAPVHDPDGAGQPEADDDVSRPGSGSPSFRGSHSRRSSSGQITSSSTSRCSHDRHSFRTDPSGATSFTTSPSICSGFSSFRIPPCTRAVSSAEIRSNSRDSVFPVGQPLVIVVAPSDCGSSTPRSRPSPAPPAPPTIPRSFPPRLRPPPDSSLISSVP